MLGRWFCRGQPKPAGDGKVKKFDCVTMKERVQAQHAKEYVGLSHDQIRQRVRLKLETSDHPAAAWWRSISSETVPPQAPTGD
jgi:hypothetical protein